MRTGALNRLTAKQVKGAVDGFHADGGGLYLRVKGAARSWVFRFTWQGKKTDMGLGPAGSVSLARAREIAAQAREKLAEGIDPRTRETPEAVARSAPTFEAALDRYLRLKAGEWSSPKHALLWENSLRIHAAQLMPIPVDRITPADIVDILVPIWKTKHDTAKRVRQRLERVLSASIALGERSGPNPAAWRDGIEFVMSKQRRDVTHHPAVPVSEAPEAFRGLWARRDSGQGTRAVIMVALTALRSGEARRLEWGDLSGDTLTVSAERMKMSRPHRVALAPFAVDWIATLPRFVGTDFVFPSTTNRPLSDVALAKAMRVAGLGDYTVHGWRATFSTWASAAGFRRDLAEDALAHQVGSDVERAYRRGDYLEQRRDLMQAWTNFLTREQT